MAKLFVKKGDKVLVITGKDKGTISTVTSVSPKEGKVIVENVNIVSRHQKPRSQNDKGGIIKKAAAIDASNVMVVCDACGKATRVKHNDLNGKNVRVCSKCGATLDKEFVKEAKKAAKKADKPAKAEKTENKKADAVKPVKETKTAKAQTNTKVATVRKTVSNSGK